MIELKQLRSPKFGWGLTGLNVTDVCVTYVFVIDVCFIDVRS